MGKLNGLIFKNTWDYESASSASRGLLGKRVSVLKSGTTKPEEIEVQSVARPPTHSAVSAGVRFILKGKCGYATPTIVVTQNDSVAIV